MEAVVEIIFRTFAAIARWAAQRYYGRMPSEAQLDAGTIAKLSNIRMNRAVEAFPRNFAIGMYVIFALLAIAVGFAIAGKFSLLVLIILGCIVTFLVVTPAWAFIQYGRDRRYLISQLRSLGRLKTCPRCEYDVSQTTSDHCPECGEAVYALPSKMDQPSSQGR